MIPRLLQDLTTIRGANSTTQIVQSASSWLDLENFEDVALYLDVREITGGPLVTYEHSPSGLDTQFTPLIPQITAALGVRVDTVLASMAAVPPSRFLRWRVNGSPGAGWSFTFRIWLAGYGWA